MSNIVPNNPKPLILASFSLLLFLIVSLCVIFFEPLAAFDLYVVKCINEFSAKHPIQIPLFITDLGDRYGMVLPVLISLFLLIYFNKLRAALLIIIASESSHIITKLTKSLFQIPRPPVEFNLVQPHSFSFPSGHSLISMVFYGFLIYFCFKYIKNNLIKWTLIILLTILIVLIGLSRIYLGVHYPSDVIGGFILGFFWINLWVVLYGIYVSKIQDIIQTE